jgi:hypothetical protein
MTPAPWLGQTSPARLNLRRPPRAIWPMKRLSPSDRDQTGTAVLTKEPGGLAADLPCSPVDDQRRRKKMIRMMMIMRRIAPPPMYM